MISDPVLFEIIKNAYETAAEEMGIAVVQGAYSTMIKELGDACSAILDSEGRLISQAVGAPLQHIASLRPSAKELLRDFPADTMRDGDIYLFNDHYRGGIHSNDIMVFRPLFLEGELKFFTASLIHVADLGGIAAGGLPATATEYFHEGLMLPPVKYFDAGARDDSLTKLICANSRTPDKVMGDLNALIGATVVGARRISDMVDQWGLERVYRTGQDVMSYSEDRTRRGIEAIPNGVYGGSYLIDDDGIDAGRRYMVNVSIKVEGSDLTLDFGGTDPQARGPINASFSQATSGVLYGVRCFLDPTIPMSEGCYQPLNISLPYGSLVNPRPPAACNARMAVIMAVIESILSGLSQAFPVKAVASSGMNHVFTMNGIDNGRYWIFMDNDYGGIGARTGKDGVDASAALISAAHSGSLPIEAVEQEYPVLYKSYRLVDDSGGPGRYRGGLGVERSLQILTEGEVTVRTDRVRIPPPGAAGGKSGVPGSYAVNPGLKNERPLPSKKTGVTLSQGDILVERTSGGGGFGHPWMRPIERVVEDVRERKVSPEAALKEYGVVVNPDTHEVDELGTQRMRSAMAADPGTASRLAGNNPKG